MSRCFIDESVVGGRYAIRGRFSRYRSEAHSLPDYAAQVFEFAEMDTRRATPNQPCYSFAVVAKIHGRPALVAAHVCLWVAWTLTDKRSVTPRVPTRRWKQRHFSSFRFHKSQVGRGRTTVRYEVHQQAEVPVVVCHLLRRPCADVTVPFLAAFFEPFVGGINGRLGLGFG